MKNTVFKGAATAIITPFDMYSRTVDFKRFANLIEWQIEKGINALVVSTLSDAEPVCYSSYGF